MLSIIGIASETCSVDSGLKINPKISTAIAEEEKFDYQKMIEECVENINTIKVNDNVLNEFSQLL